MHRLISAIGVLLVVTGSYAAESFRDPGGHFTLLLPEGWSVGETDAETGHTALVGEGETIAVTFHESQPAKWTVDTLMSVGEAGVRTRFPEAEALEAEDLTADGLPGRLVAYRAFPGLNDRLLPIVGCVILEDGGVQLLGIMKTASSRKSIRTILESVRAIKAE